MHTSGRMVFTMTLLAAATPFVLPRVLAPAGSPNAHPAAIGNAHPANFGNAHPADFGNPHPANFGDPHPALTAEKHAAFPSDVVNNDENVTIDPSQVNGHVTFAFPKAAHVTIVLPDGVQFAVNDTRGFNQQAVPGFSQQPIPNQHESWPGFAPLVGPVLQTNIVRNPASQVATNVGIGRTAGMALATNRSEVPSGAENPINEAAGAQPSIQFRR
jgi:hypothetical protein